jgi:hypothetical protein
MHHPRRFAQATTPATAQSTPLAAPRASPQPAAPRRAVGARLAVAGAAAALAAACQGPGLLLHGEGTCYVDGRVEKRARIPFRYYGTTTLDAVPAQPATDPSSQLLPVRQAVAIDAPVAQWLFPFDFLGELAVRAFAGTQDQVVYAAPAPADQAVVQGFTPAGLEDLRQRSDAARISR